MAMAAWLGGVAMLVLAVRSATRAVEPGDRLRLLTSVVARFSAMAGVAIAVILLTGVAQSIVYVESPKHLLDTAFGRAVLIKSVLFVLICGLGFFNRNRLLPRLRAAQESAAGAGVLLRRTLRLELAIGVAVIAVTGALAGYPPSTAVSAGPFSGSAVLGPARVEVTVDPAKTGANEMHLYLFNRRSGAQWDRADEVTVRAELPGKGIEPIPMPTQKAGPGHYVISGATFGVAGDWKVEIEARVGEFDLYAATLGVPVE
jgi:copper transport protein